MKLRRSKLKSEGPAFLRFNSMKIVLYFLFHYLQGIFFTWNT